MKVTLKGLAARPVRTLLSALAIVVGVAFVAAALTLTGAMRGAADSLSSAAYDGTDAVVVAKTAFDPGVDSFTEQPVLPAATLERVRSAPGVEVAVGDISDSAQIIGRDGDPVGTGPYFGSGFDAATPGAEALTPFRLADGRWAAGPGEVVIDQGTSENEDYALGSRIRVATRGEAREFEVVGIATFADVKSLGVATFAVFDLDAAQTLFAKDGYDRVLVAGDTRGVAAAAGSDAAVRSAAADDRFDLEGLKSFVDILRTILLAFAGVALLVGAFTIFNALSIAIAQRTRELGLLRMVGASRRQVRRGVLIEALAIGLGASLVGIVVGVLLASGLEGLFDAMGLSLPVAGLSLSGGTIVAGLLVGTGVTLVAALLPARRATRVPPVAALREAGEGGGRVRLPGRIVRFVTGLVARPSERLGGTAGSLARRNAMRHPGRTAATAAALLIGVALVTAVTVVANGLEDVSAGSLDRRVQAGTVISATDGWSPIDPAIERAAASAPGVTAVSSMRQDGALAFGQEEGVNGVDPATVTKVFAYDLTAGDEAAVAALGAGGALVDEGWAIEHGLAVGDRFEITAPRGDRLALTVRAIEESPVLDIMGLGPITISREAFDGTFAAERNRFTLVAGGDVAAIEKAIAAFPEAEALSKADYIELQTQFIGQILAVLWVLLALAVIVSLFGIVNTLVLATFERRRELGTLRAMGMSRRQLRRMVRHESIITALMGALPGIAVGLGIAFAAVAALGEYGLEFVIPTGALVAVAAIAVLAGMAAAVLPARRASRTDVLAALAYE
ncbi:MAG TPA: FtsX-like permease family protein [Solirubrobacteraceae bacterium]|nr:FtsX-like permease family protein [Solirubrobacteraceae bacterium]